MPKEAKLGLILGLAVVIVIALVFFRKESPENISQAATSIRSAPKQAKFTSNTKQNAKVEAPTQLVSNKKKQPYRYKVVEGDTLYSLARRFYQDDSKFVDIYRANIASVATPERLEPGTMLVIPGIDEPPPVEPDALPIVDPLDILD